MFFKVILPDHNISEVPFSNDYRLYQKVTPTHA